MSKKARFFDVNQLYVCAHICILANIGLFAHEDGDGLELDIVF